MSKDQLRSFLATVQADSSLQAQLKAASSADTVIEIAKKAGYTITVDELKNTHSELSDQELERVSGGNIYPEVGCVGAAAKSMLDAAYWKNFTHYC